MNKNEFLPNFDPFSGFFLGILDQKGGLCHRIRLYITNANNLSLFQVYPPLTNLKFILLSLPHHLYLVALFCAEYHKGLNYPLSFSQYNGQTTTSQIMPPLFSTPLGVILTTFEVKQTLYTSAHGT